MTDAEPSAFRFIHTSAPSPPGKSELSAIRSHVSRANAAARAVAAAAAASAKKRKKPRRELNANLAAKLPGADPSAERQSQHANFQEHVRERVIRKSLLNHFYHGLDPLSLHPELKGGKARTQQLLHHASDVLLSMFESWRYWRQAVVSSAAAFTGYSVLASVHLDMLYGESGESPQTLTAKGKAIRLINKRLEDPKTQFDEVTMLAVTAMQAVEMLGGESSAQQAHIRGIDLMIQKRGGPRKFVESGGLAVEIVRSHVINVLYVSILNELKPAAFWTEFWEPIAPERPRNSAGQPISPLHCPDEDLHTILTYTECSNHTYALLTDMKGLLDVLLSLQTQADSQSLGSPRLTSKIELLRARFSAAPSATDPNVHMQGDWIYEACRLVALLTITAVYNGVPLSQASKLLHQFETEASGTPTLTPIQQLWNALSKTPLMTRWAGMFGVLIWVALTGAASASRSTGNTAKYNVAVDPAEDTARRWVVMTAGSCMSILNTEHAWAFRAHLLRMVRLQEILGSKEWNLAVPEVE